jgi:OOP family OmpA-OmpF porin
MKNTFTRKEFALAAACALALGVFSEIALSQPAWTPNEQALLRDSAGQPVMSGFGTCVRTGYGPAPQWTRECHAPIAPVAIVPVAPAPKPVVAPIVVAAAAPLPGYEKVAFDANVLFNSNKAVLLPAGRETLDKFVASIQGLEAQSIAAIGYADRMGSDASNQALSELRVEAVKAYLVDKGIKAERVETSARGETRPTTSPGECKDANNAKNVACMQPDRHVFIEISGSRIAQ